MIYETVALHLFIIQMMRTQKWAYFYYNFKQMEGWNEIWLTFEPSFMYLDAIFNFEISYFLE